MRCWRWPLCCNELTCGLHGTWGPVARSGPLLPHWSSEAVLWRQPSHPRGGAAADSQPSCYQVLIHSMSRRRQHPEKYSCIKQCVCDAVWEAAPAQLQVGKRPADIPAYTAMQRHREPHNIGEQELGAPVRGTKPAARASWTDTQRDE